MSAIIRRNMRTKASRAYWRSLEKLFKCPCKKHRAYKGMRHPRTICVECWRFFFDVQREFELIKFHNRPRITCSED